MLIGNPESAATIVRVCRDLRDNFSPSMNVFDVLSDIAYNTKHKWLGIKTKRPELGMGEELGMSLEKEITYDLFKDFGMCPLHPKTMRIEHWPATEKKAYIWGRKVEMFAVRSIEKKDAIVGFLVMRSFDDDYWQTRKEEADEMGKEISKEKWKYYELDQFGGLCFLDIDKNMPEELLRRCPDNEADLTTCVNWIVGSKTIDRKDPTLLERIPETLIKKRGYAKLVVFNTMPTAVNSIVRNQMRFTAFIAALLHKQGKLNTRMGKPNEFWGEDDGRRVKNDKRVRKEDADVLSTLLGMQEGEHRDVNAVWPQYWVDIQSLTTIHCIHRDAEGVW